ncbi:hypothetical protein J6590_039559 [Homalodisca vitripennis]|nr:hypothetical protein J6590_039559 [Homalodisca vitripennis]
MNVFTCSRPPVPAPRRLGRVVRILSQCLTEPIYQPQLKGVLSASLLSSGQCKNSWEPSFPSIPDKTGVTAVFSKKLSYQKPDFPCDLCTHNLMYF